MLQKDAALQSRGGKGEAVVLYCEPLTTKDLKCSGFPEREKAWRKHAWCREFTGGCISVVAYFLYFPLYWPFFDAIRDVFSVTL
jgi:hypothetical protein